jgi:hypothetical protein
MAMRARRNRNQSGRAGRRTDRGSSFGRVHELDHVGVDASSALLGDSSAASVADSSEEMFPWISLESSQTYLANHSTLCAHANSAENNCVC